MNDKYSVLIVEDDQFSRENLRLSLSKKFNLFTSLNVADALEVLSANAIDLVILDIKLPGENGLSLIEKAKVNYPGIKYIVITGYSDEKSIISALKLGADDLLKKPYDEQELHDSVNKQIRSIELERENSLLKEKLIKENIILKKDLNKNLEPIGDVIIGKSPLLLDTLNKAKQVANHNINLMICGESGTGKELLARYIHSNGTRSNKPFVAINCASLTSTLFESELFGHEKGSFTSADHRKIGLLEIADGGILFLDEITEINLDLQAKLLRVVEEKKIQRVGGNSQIKVDVQILSSTNRDLSDAIKNGKLREDLYHRLASTILELPPLRKRIDDLPHLFKYFNEKYNTIYNITSPEIDKETFALMKQSNWSGNIRQFSNFVKNWCLFGTNAKQDEIQRWINSESNNRIHSDESFHFEKGNMSEMDEAKQWLIERALSKFNGNKTKAAEHLGVSYAGFLKMLKNL